MQRHFIDWGRPFLRELVKDLIGKKSLNGKLDLSDLVLVFPSSRALHQFEELLTKEVEKNIQENLLASDWFPPESITIGRLPELLYVPRKPFAPHTVTLLAWKKALELVKEKNPAGIASLFPSLSKEENFSEYIAYAEKLSQLQTELASENADFSAPTKGIKRLSLSLELQKREIVRWQVLYEIEKEYYAILDRNKLCDKQAERKEAIANHSLQTDKTIILANVIDLNRLQKAVLDQISDHIQIYTSAPESEETLFDSYGCVIPDLWKTRKITIPESSFIQTSDPIQEGETAALLAKKFGTQSADSKTFDPKLVTISTPDPETTPFLTAALADLGIPAHISSGTPALENRVFLLLQTAANFLKTQAFDHFAALVRHPDVEQTIRRKFPGLAGTDWLTSLDTYQNENVPLKFSLKNLCKDSRVNHLISAAAQLLAPFRTPSEPLSSAEEDLKFDSIPQQIEQPDSLSLLHIPLTEYPAVIAAFLETFYAHPDAVKNTCTEEANRQIDEGMKILHRLIDELLQIPEELDLPLFADQALNILLSAGRNFSIPAVQISHSIELIGWLDALFDNAPNLIVTGLNDGIVPKSQTGDAYLPNTVRQELLLEDNDRRYARDAYALSAIAANRNIRLLFAEKSLIEDPLLPSRLLFTGEPIEIAERVSRFFSGGPAPFPAELLEDDITAESPSEEPARQESRIFALPVLRMTDPLPDRISVTDFATFLSSPYKYFLEKILNLKRIKDNQSELNDLSFGNIVHHILSDFGKDESIRDSEDEKKIRSFLSASLEKQRKILSENYSAGTVILQMDIIQERLNKFAQWQAQWRKKGPKITFFEKSPANPLFLEGEGIAPIQLSGRIDRIDYDEVHNQWFIFDYKTSDKKTANGSQQTKQKDSLTEDAEWNELLAPFIKTDGDENQSLLDLQPNNEVEKKHRTKAEGRLLPFETDVCGNPLPYRWINLQLPLYTKLADQILAEEGCSRGQKPFALGYILFPKAGNISAPIGIWTSEDLEIAHQTALWVIKMIERLWTIEIDPKSLADPDVPDWGLILDPKISTNTNDLLSDFIP